MKPSSASQRLQSTALGLALGIFATTAHAADFTATWNGTSGNWTDATKWSTNPSFPNNGTSTFDAIQNGGSVTLNQNITIQGYTLTGGFLSGTGFDLTLNGALAYSGGTIGGSGSLNANGGAVLSGGNKVINRVLNFGAITDWTAGNIIPGAVSSSPAQINVASGAEFRASASGSITADSASRTKATFNNSGIFIKSGVGTTTSFANASNAVSNYPTAFNNTALGTVQVASGTLEFLGGGTGAGVFDVANGATLKFSPGHAYTLNGATLNGSGTILITGNVIASGAVASNAPISLSGGTLGGAGTVTASAPITLTGGTLVGAGAINANSGISFTGGSMIINRVLNLGANSTWSGGNLISGADSTSPTQINVANGVEFRATASGAVTADSATRRAATFNNSGAFIKSGAGTTTTFANVSNAVSNYPSAFNNSASGTVQVASGTLELLGGGTGAGVFDVANGATLRFGTGQTYAFNGATVGGPGAMQVTGSISATGSVALNAPVSVNGGTLRGTGTFNVAQILPLNNVTITESGTLNALNGVEITGVTTTISAERVLNLSGTSTWSSGNLLVHNTGGFGPTPQINILPGSQFLATNSGSVTGDATSRSISSFNNSGTFVKSGPGTTTIFANISNASSTYPSVFNNSATGTVQVASGTLEILGGGTGTGNFNVSSGGTLKFGAGQAYTLNGATLSGPGDTVITGNVNVTGTVGTTSPITLTSGGITVSGTLSHGNGSTPISSTWTGGSITLTNGGTLTNAAGATIATNFGGTVAATGTGTKTFNNAGTFTKSGTATTTTISAAFHNSGTVNADSGTLSFTGTYSQTAGKLVLNGGSVTKTGGTLAINGGSIEGSGTITGTTAVTAATIAPGFSPGALTFAGDLTITAATVFNMEIGGLIQGVGYDFISEAGSTALNLNGSTLNLSLINGFEPSNFQTFALIQSNQAIQGAFANIASGGIYTLPQGSFTVTYAGQNSVTLSNFVPVPEPSSYALLAGLAGLALALHRRKTRQS